MKVRPEVLPFLACSLGAALILAAAVAAIGRNGQAALLAGVFLFLLLSAYMLYFFRDPDRHPPADADVVLAGADGYIAGIKTLTHEAFLQRCRAAGLQEEQVASFPQRDVVRISIFLSLFDVHVNRTPIAGHARFLGYFPGKHFFTFDEKSSDHNQHNAILIDGEKTCCLVTQIVGPVCRRVVYWPDHDRPVLLEQGARFGMMKFGSRLDMYFPQDDLTLCVEVNETVRAGETILARLTEKESS